MRGVEDRFWSPAIELFGTTGLWFQNNIFGLLGAMALFSTSLGAIAFHLRYDTWKDGTPAMVTLILSGLVIYLGW